MDTKQFKRLLKELQMPAMMCGINITDQGPKNKAKWAKLGGHAGSKVLSRVRIALDAAGFALDNCGGDVSPDGSRVAHGTVYVKDEVTVTLHSFYGEEACRNRFEIIVHD